MAWAHPKFGSILASCSYDGKVIIWKEEAASNAGSQGQYGARGGYSGQKSGGWQKIKEHAMHTASGEWFATRPAGLRLTPAWSSSHLSQLDLLGAT